MPIHLYELLETLDTDTSQRGSVEELMVLRRNVSSWFAVNSKDHFYISDITENTP